MSATCLTVSTNDDSKYVWKGVNQLDLVEKNPPNSFMTYKGNYDNLEFSATVLKTQNDKPYSTSLEMSTKVINPKLPTDKNEYRVLFHLKNYADPGYWLLSQDACSSTGLQMVNFHGEDIGKIYVDVKGKKL
jgi:hypothetical protein